ncbi:MAG: hypothetical protein HS107_15680 [Thermoflexaceae bacterium]|nr:hypothetical protein [Thermoflexaceae bacterium]
MRVPESRVHVVGDAAVRPFNHVSRGGREDAYRWNCTGVCRRTGERREVIQAHWPNTPGTR